MLKNIMLFIIICCVLQVVFSACGPVAYHPNYEVYRPEIIDDGEPEIEGNYIELSKNQDLNLHQKCLREALYRGGGYSNHPVMSINDLGITNLNLLKTIEGINTAAIFYSTRLNNIDGLKGFKKLEYIDIRGSDMADFTILEEFPFLKYLGISYSKAKDLQSLANCISLQELTIDKESNYSLEPLKYLMQDHLNNEGKKIKLEVKYIKDKLKEYRVVKDQPIFGKVTPTLKGAFDIYDVSFATNLTGGNYYSIYKGGNTVGSLVMTDNTFTFTINDPGALNLSFSKNGTYTSTGNLIFFKTDEGIEFINSFYWETSKLSFSLYDRVNYPDYDWVVFSAKKISDDPNYFENK